MSTRTKDRRSPVDELTEDEPFIDLEDTPTKLAPSTPLTREAVIHLRAAAMEIDGTIATARTILRTVEEALADPSGGEKVLSEERRMDLARLLSEAEVMSGKAVCAVFERGRGERPHGKGPHLTLDEEADRDFAFILLVISYLGVVDIRDSDKLRRQVLGKISVLADNLLQQLEEQPGMESLFEDLQEEADRRASEIKQELAGDAVKPEGAPGDASGNISGSDRGGAS